MGTIIFSGQVGDRTPLTHSVSVDDADIASMMGAEGTLLFPGGVTDADTGQQRAPTTQEIFTALCRRVVSQIVEESHQFYATRAANAAYAVVPRIKVSEN